MREILLSGITEDQLEHNGAICFNIDVRHWPARCHRYDIAAVNKAIELAMRTRTRPYFYILVVPSVLLFLDSWRKNCAIGGSCWQTLMVMNGCEQVGAPLPGSTEIFLLTISNMQTLLRPDSKILNNISMRIISSISQTTYTALCGQIAAPNPERRRCQSSGLVSGKGVTKMAIQ